MNTAVHQRSPESVQDCSRLQPAGVQNLLW